MKDVGVGEEEEDMFGRREGGFGKDSEPNLRKERIDRLGCQWYIRIITFSYILLN